MVLFVFTCYSTVEKIKGEKSNKKENLVKRHKNIKKIAMKSS